MESAMRTGLLGSVSALLAAALFALPVSAQGKQLTIHWHGQAFFDIQTSAGTRIAIDPHAEDHVVGKLVAGGIGLELHPVPLCGDEQVVENPVLARADGPASACRRPAPPPRGGACAEPVAGCAPG